LLDEFRWVDQVYVLQMLGERSDDPDVIGLAAVQNEARRAQPGRATGIGLNPAHGRGQFLKAPGWLGVWARLDRPGMRFGHHSNSPSERRAVRIARTRNASFSVRNSPVSPVGGGPASCPRTDWSQRPAASTARPSEAVIRCRLVWVFWGAPRHTSAVLVGS